MSAIRLFLIVCFTLVSTAVSAAEDATVSVDKRWGLLIGDEFTATVILPIGEGDIDPTSLPQTDKRYGIWLFLKTLTLHGHEMTLRYQVINVPKQNQAIETPALAVADKKGEFVTIPPTSVVIGPLLPAAGTDEALDLTPRPDRQASLLPTAQLSRQQMQFILLALVSALILVAWHIGWKPRNRAPFSQALQELLILRWTRRKEPDQAARILHKAFNHAAGTVIVTAELEQLFQSLPWLQPLRQDIETFYRQSATRFFSRDAEKSFSFDDVYKLAKACRAREKVA